MTGRFYRGALSAAAVLALTALPLDAQVAERDYQARRAALAASVGDGVILVFGATEPEEPYAPLAQRPRFPARCG